MNNFLSELKRRNVVRVGIAYGVVSWVVLQLVDVLDEILELPDGFGKAVLIIILIGFPIVLLVSWAYEVTPEGVMKTEAVDKSKSVTHSTGQKINKLIIGGLVLAVAFLLVDKFFISDNGVEEAVAGEASIAVLPFVNMSDDAGNEYFADGLSEELLNVLAKVPDLKVAGRTSSFQFKGQNLDLRMIGETLGVAHILEGSVRKQGNRVRITAQLIRASDGFHMWSDTYDRDLEDIFAVQDEISGAIFNELSLTLQLDGQTRASAPPTTNMAAYDRFLEARVLVAQRGTENLYGAEALLLEVTQIDPGYAEAWALLGNVYSLIPAYDNTADPPSYSKMAVTAAERAIDLNPNIGLAYTGLGSALISLRQYKAAAEAFEKGWEFNKSDAEGNTQIAQFMVAMGKMDEALPYAKRAYELDPLSELNALIYGTNLHHNGKKIEGLEVLNGVQSARFQSLKAYLEMNLFLIDGDLGKGISAGITATKIRKFSQMEAMYQALNAPDLTRERALETLQYSWDNRTDQAIRSSSWYSGFVLFYKDYELAIKMMREDAASPRSGFIPADLFLIRDLDFLTQPATKEFIKELGVLEYWLAYGFPSYCRAVGEEDFACE